MPHICIACGALVAGRTRQARMCIPCMRARYFDPVKLAAHREVGRARRAGTLADPRTLKCTDCSRPATEYDHREYRKPLDVEPVCRRCNLLRGPAIDALTWTTSPIKGRRPVAANDPAPAAREG